jgi:restriction endonuclease S subunit
MWKTVKLGDVCELIGGGTPSQMSKKAYKRWKYSLGYCSKTI